MKRLERIASSTHLLEYSTLDTPIGELVLFASSTHLHHVLWAHEAHTARCTEILGQLGKATNHPVMLETKQQLSEYFDKQRQTFDLPLCLDGTAFQVEAWQVLTQIPYGQTLSYGEQASQLGNKNKARAVGLANGLNPISIIVPCHRVIGCHGALTGFGGGLENKRFLLNLEGCTL